MLLWSSRRGAICLRRARLQRGVAPLFNLAGPGNLYVDNQGTQGFIYNFGNNFESYNFRNPTTGQAWERSHHDAGTAALCGAYSGGEPGRFPVVFPLPYRGMSGRSR